MTYAARATRQAHRLVRRFGDGATVTIRREGSLHNERTGAEITALAVNGAESSGATTVNLDAANLAGTLARGAVLTIAGNAGHVVQADVEASSNALASVSILSALVANVADDAAVTVTQSHGEWTQAAVRRGITEAEQANETFSGAEYVLVVSLLGYEGPEWGDGVTVDFDGEEVAVIRQMPFEPGTTRAAMRLVCAGRAA